MEVGVRDLRNNLSRWIERVRRGQEVVVTDRGKPVARLTSVVESPAERRLIAAGLIEEPNETKKKIQRRGRITPRGSVSELVKEQRR